MKRLALAAALFFALAAPTWAGFDEGIAAYLGGDYATATQEFEKLAEEGHAGAQFSLGVMYFNGEGTPPNYAEAMKWYHGAILSDLTFSHRLGQERTFGDTTRKVCSRV